MAKKRVTDKQYLKLWEQFRENISKSTPVDLNETPLQKEARIKELEGNPEKWFKYYFPNFYTSEPAPFHKRATKRILKNPEWFEVRPWARELSKSGRTMMEVIYLTVAKKTKKNVLMVSSSGDNAERLLLPYKSIFEKNNRLIHDYGEFQSIGQWEAGEFVTKQGVSFRALGAGQSPRGTRKDEVRPDVILIDDIDTDEESRNKDRIKKKIDWVEQALIPTRSISNPLLIIVCGNIIGKYTTVTEMMKKADHAEIVNIRDKHGKSTWPSKNTEVQIDRVLKTISNRSAQKEYFNNPVSEGTVFKEITYDKVPQLRHCEKVLIYVDPSPSNNIHSKSSRKAVGIIGFYKGVYYLYKIWLDNVTNAQMIEWMHLACLHLDSSGVDPKRLFVENNSLQDPFYKQVVVPLVNDFYDKNKYRIPIRPDNRKKPSKFERIEGTLEPLNRNGFLKFNLKEKENPHMMRMEEEMLSVSEDCKTMDGPDMLEGGVWLIQNRIVKAALGYAFGEIENRHY
ncbi:MAG: hypothetical protein H3C36_02895 [Chitinophagaceae bacterium]|nr:hypothetical protein [Chitinophagaceae bacterium]